MLSTRYCQIQMHLEFSQQTFEKSSNIKFHHIHQVSAELFHAHRQTDEETDMTKLVVAFRKLRTRLNNTCSTTTDNSNTLLR
jgi:hypothetical protein